MRFGTTGEVFSVFLKLGLTSFGGPIAHLGFFHRELIERRQWISESQYAQLLALCQFLPGPASSQLGFALGLLRANWSGAIAAFLAFTLPSALLLFGFAALLPQLSGPTGTAAIHGLKLVALAVVAVADEWPGAPFAEPEGAFAPLGLALCLSVEPEALSEGVPVLSPLSRQGTPRLELADLPEAVRRNPSAVGLPLVEAALRRRPGRLAVMAGDEPWGLALSIHEGGEP